MSLLGLRWLFLDRASSGIDMSVYPQLQLENGTGSVARGIAEPGPNLFLPVQVARAFGKTKWVGEVGYQTLRGQRNEWVAGVLGARPLTATLDRMAAVRSVSQNFRNSGELSLHAGLRPSRDRAAGDRTPATVASISPRLVSARSNPYLQKSLTSATY